MSFMYRHSEECHIYEEKSFKQAYPVQLHFKIVKHRDHKLENWPLSTEDNILLNESIRSCTTLRTQIVIQLLISTTIWHTLMFSFCQYNCRNNAIVICLQLDNHGSKVGNPSWYQNWTTGPFSPMLTTLNNSSSHTEHRQLSYSESH